MSEQENRSLVRRYIDQFVNGGDLDSADELLARDYRRYLSPSVPPLTVEQQKQRIAGLRTAFPDLRLTVEDMLADGDRVAFRGVIRGTHAGAFMGIAPTGKEVTVFAMDVVRIEGGRFAEHWGGPDLLGMLLQLGAVVSAGPASK